jgi:hypothetical protein
MTLADMPDDQAPKQVRPQNNNAWMSNEDRAESLGFRLTLDQIKVLARDTRLPGEIGCSYGCSAAVIIRLQERGRRLILKREKLAVVARRLDAAK